MNQNTVSGDMIALKLRQLKADQIEMIHSNMYFVSFTLENGTPVSYVFNITKGEKYFLQRMRPYAMVSGKFADANEIVEFIRNDITMFRNAANSKNFPSFLETLDAGMDVLREIEMLFLSHNVSPEALHEIKEHLKEAEKQIQAVGAQADRVHLP